MNNGKIIKVLFVRSALVNDLCMSIAKQHSNVVAKNEMFISAVGSQSWIDAEVDHVVGKIKKALEVLQVRLFSSSPKEKILKSPHRTLFLDLTRLSPSSMELDSCQRPLFECLEELLSGMRRSVR